jgi:hypothetical protein
MRKSIAMRFDPDLLALARLQAVRENRSLTNFVETAVRQRLADCLSTTAPSSIRTGMPLTTTPTADQDA